MAKLIKEHNLTADAVEVEVTQIYGQIRKRTETTIDAPQNIISTVSTKFSEVAAPHLVQLWNGAFGILDNEILKDQPK